MTESATTEERLVPHQEAFADGSSRSGQLQEAVGEFAHRARTASGT